MAEKSSYASSSSLERMRRLSKSDDRLNRFDSVQSASPQSVRPPHAQTCLPVTRVLEVLRLDNVLTSEQCTAAATHLESMPVSNCVTWNMHEGTRGRPGQRTCTMVSQGQGGRLLSMHGFTHFCLFFFW